jgi:hypothetical protein
MRSLCRVQGEELEPARAKAEQMGVKEIYIDDLREEFVRDFVFPMFRCVTLLCCCCCCCCCCSELLCGGCCCCTLRRSGAAAAAAAAAAPCTAAG